MVAGLAPLPAGAAENAAQLPGGDRSSGHETAKPPLTVAAARQRQRARFERESPSIEARNVADWVVDSQDNGRLPFIIVDKVNAKVFVFDVDGGLRGASPALLGMAPGDDSAPGVGDRQLSSILPEERTTPAGRYVAELGRNAGGKDILWVSYDDAVSLHRVVSSKPAERRLQRLATPTPLDNRISYGCINVPAKFYDQVVGPAFSGKRGIVYVLPEVRSIPASFPSYYDVEAVSVAPVR